MKTGRLVRQLGSVMIALLAQDNGR